MTVPSVLDPQGPAAAEIAVLWWVMLAAATAVLALTVVLAALAARRNPAPLRGHRFIWTWGVALPVVVLTALMAATVVVGGRVSRPPHEPAVTVEVTGHQFWWEVRYPDEDVTTANEIHVPVGQPVRLVLRSADVIHSFWVPQLQGKMDLIPGHENEFWLQADAPGEYRGLCAEFCGIQHARMQLLVVAEAGERFAAWLDRQRAPAAEPAGELATAGRDVFLTTTCAECHQIRGLTPPHGRAPDLTHLATRRTIAAGILPNNRGALGGWILDPQSSKPGALMPPTHLSGDQLQALLAYLEQLE